MAAEQWFDARVLHLAEEISHNLQKSSDFLFYRSMNHAKWYSIQMQALEVPINCLQKEFRNYQNLIAPPIHVSSRSWPLNLSLEDEGA